MKPSKTHKYPPTIPSDREDGSSSFVHLAILTSGKIGSLHPICLLPIWLILFAILYSIWQNDKIPVVVLSIIILGLDWSTLALLPVKNRSWGPVTPPLLFLTLTRFLYRVIFGLMRNLTWNWILCVVIDTLTSFITIYATWIEPFHIKITRKKIHLPASMLPQQLRVLHITDIHYEGTSPREEKLLKIIEEETPDIILLTGDYLNLSSVYDSEAQLNVKEILNQLKAPLGVYAVTGSPAVDHTSIVPRIFEDLSIHWLQDIAVPLPLDESNIWIMGIVNTYNEKRDENALKQISSLIPDGSFSLLLYHTPDLMPIATELGVNLYLCGHTHGGQISLPLYGALVTSSKFGKRYERGFYQEKNTMLYVSRGLGVEGMGAPRARFFSPPEVCLWTMVTVSESPLTEDTSVV